MEDVSSFFVTLPSNVDEKLYPDNTNGSYRTRLASSLTLSRDEWLVGLTEISYSNSWHNVDIGGLSWTETTTSESPGRDTPIAPITRVVVRKVQRGRYTHEELIGAVTSAVRGTLLQGRLRVLRNRFANRISIRVPSNVSALAFTDDINQMLGFPDGTAISYPGASAKAAPDVERGMTALYVYTNAISDRLVGNSHVPLVRFVPVVGGAFAEQHYEPKNTQYHPANNLRGHELAVKIARDTGDIVRFETGKVIVTLHFKRRKR